MSKYYALADIILLRFDVRAFAHTYFFILSFFLSYKKSDTNTHS